MLWAFAVAGGISVLLVIVGAVTTGLATATSVGMGWLLWRYWRRLREAASAELPVAGDVHAQDGPEPGQRRKRLWQHLQRASEGE